MLGELAYPSDTAVFVLVVLFHTRQVLELKYAFEKPLRILLYLAYVRCDILD